MSVSVMFSSCMDKIEPDAIDNLFLRFENVVKQNVVKQTQDMPCTLASIVQLIQYIDKIVWTLLLDTMNRHKESKPSWSVKNRLKAGILAKMARFTTEVDCSPPSALSAAD